MYNYLLKNEGGQFTPHNTTVDDKNEIFENLIFHGGPGSTLEMRIFCQSDLINHFQNAGFKKLNFLDVENPDLKKYGICWENNYSLTMLVEM